MTPEESAALRRTLVGIIKDISFLRGSEDAMQHVISDLVRERAISIEAAQILARYHEYRDEAISAVHEELEGLFPFLAAELDRGRNEPPAEPPQPDESK